MDKCPSTHWTGKTIKCTLSPRCIKIFFCGFSYSTSSLFTRYHNNTAMFIWSCFRIKVIHLICCSEINFSKIISISNLRKHSNMFLGCITKVSIKKNILKHKNYIFGEKSEYLSVNYGEKLVFFLFEPPFSARYFAKMKSISNSNKTLVYQRLYSRQGRSEGGGD